MEALTSASEERRELEARLEEAEHEAITMRTGLQHQQQMVLSLEEELKQMVRTYLGIQRPSLLVCSNFKISKFQKFTLKSQEERL